MPDLFRRQKACGRRARMMLVATVLFASAVLPRTRNISAQTPVNAAQAPVKPPQAAAKGVQAEGKSAQAPTKETVLPLEIAWTATLGGPAATAPAYDESRAYIAVRATDEEPARLVAVSLADGARAWRIELGGIDSLAAGDGFVFVATGTTLHAFDANSGDLKWNIALASPLSAPLCQVSGWLLAATQDAKVMAARSDDGGKIWQVDTGSPVVIKPAVSGEALYLGHADNHVSMLRLRNGDLAWHVALDARPTVILALEDRAFVGTRGRWFYALNPANGKVAWRADAGAEVIGAPIVDERRLYFVSLVDMVRALNRHNGSVMAQHVLERRASFGPYRVADLILVSGMSNTVEVFSADKLNPSRPFDSPGDLGAPLHVVGGFIDRDVLIVTVTGEGELLAIRPAALSPR